MKPLKFLLLVLLALPAVVQAQLFFTTNNGAITITGYNGATDFVNIPSTTNGYPVTSIGVSAFNGSYIAGVTIPNSVTNIGAYAFEGNSGLSSVTIGTNVTSIGDFAFAYCANLPNVTIPNSVTNIGDFAFDGSQFLTKVTIGTNFTSIGTNAFYQSSLTSITLGTNVTSIGDNAFYDCTGITNVTIPSSVTNIGFNAFGVCESLTNITVSAQNPAYSSLNGVVFNKSQTVLVQYPIGRRGNYTIPNSVTNIGGYAFFDSRLLCRNHLISGASVTG